MQRLRVQLILFTLIRVFLNTLFRMVYPFLPVFQRGLGADLRSISMALTARSISGALGPFLATFADLRGRKAGMVIGLTIFNIGVIAVVLWPAYPAFFLALVLTALGKAVFDASVQAYLGDRVPYGNRGLAIAFTEYGWSLSFILGVPLMGFLISSAGWVSPFPILALLGAISLAVLARYLPGDPGQLLAEQSLYKKMWGVLSYRPALAGLGVGLFASSANEMINLVFGVWLEASFGVVITTLGAVSVVIGLSELGGETLVSAITDRIGKQRAIAGGLLLNSLAVVSLWVIGRSLTGALIGLFLFYITFEFTVVSSITLMTEILPKSRATLLATNAAGLSLGRALGAFLAPQVYTGGLFLSALVVIGFNLIALLALRGTKHVGMSADSP